MPPLSPLLSPHPVQFVSQKVISPQQQSTDPSQQQTQAILQFLPLMIGEALPLPRQTQAACLNWRLMSPTDGAACWAVPLAPQRNLCLPGPPTTPSHTPTTPLPAGYFSLNVPSGLTLYWFTNNLLTTAQQVGACA